MSTLMDERVVSMQFDNARFEQNANKTLSTLDKLKEKLDLSRSADSLQNLSKAASSFSLHGVEAAIQEVHNRFKLTEVLGITALTNITNKAVNAGERIAKALTIQPITTGFQEYETKIDAIQTIMSNTASKGTTMKEVTATLDELNEYADLTIYNFAQMTKNIGTFTAAGVELQTASKSIQGIANLAAASGSSSQQASTAMYQLSQAIAAGTVKLQDWNSVVNAGMGGTLFQEALKDTAREFGTDVDSIIESEGSFRASMQKGWITAEVLTTTLEKFTRKGAKEYAAAMLQSGKYTQAQADALMAQANNMEDAATKVKTFTQLWDTLKETAQSGWSKTWEIVIGDFVNAREFLSYLNDRFSPIIDKMSDARNSLLQMALGSKWDSMIEKINKAGIATEDFEKAVTEAAKKNHYQVDWMIETYGGIGEAFTRGVLPVRILRDTLRQFSGEGRDAAADQEELNNKLEKFQKVVDDVWRGDYGNQDPDQRFKALTEAGYEYEEVQDLVNKTVDGHRLTLADLNEEELRYLGYTWQEIQQIKALSDISTKTGKDMEFLISTMSEKTGRELLIDSIKNTLTAIGNIAKSIGSAWRDIFPAAAAENLYNIILGFNLMTENLKNSTEDLENLKKTFRGLFAAIDIVKTVVSGPLSLAFKIAYKVLDKLGYSVLGFTGGIGDAIYAVRNFIKENDYIAVVVEKVSDAIANIIAKIAGFFSVIKESTGEGADFMKSLIDNIGVALGKSLEYIYTQASQIGTDTIAGLCQGIAGGFKKVGTLLVDLVKMMIGTTKSELDSHSPSKVFAQIGSDVIEGLVNGILKLGSYAGNALITVLATLLNGANWLITGVVNLIPKGIELARQAIDKLNNDTNNALPNMLDTTKSYVEKLIGVISSTLQMSGFQDIIAGILSMGGLTASLRLSRAVEVMSKPFGVIAEQMGGMQKIIVTINNAIKGVSKGISKFLKGAAFDLRADGILKLAEAFGILALSMIVLTKFTEPDKMDMVIQYMYKIAALLLIMTTVNSLMSSIVGVKGGIASGAASVAFVQMAAAFAALAAVMLVLQRVDPTKMDDIVKKLETILSVFAVAVVELKILTMGNSGANLAKAAVLIGILPIVALEMLAVTKIASMMNPETVFKGLVTLTAISALFFAVIAISHYANAHAHKAALMIGMMGLTFLAMTVVVGIISHFNETQITRAMLFVIGVGLVFKMVTKVTAFAGDNAAKAGLAIMGMGAAFLAMTVSMAILQTLRPDKMKGALIAIGIFGAIIAVLVVATHLAGDNANKLLGFMIGFSVAMAALTASVFALSWVKEDNLKRATIAVSIMEALLAVVVACAGKMEKTKGAIIALTVLLVSLTAAFIVLSRIDNVKLLAISAAIGGVFKAMAKSIQAYAVLMKEISATNQNNRNAKSAIMQLVGITALTILLLTSIAAILSWLSKGESDFSNVKVAASLAIVLASVSLMFRAIGKYGKQFKKIKPDGLKAIGVLMLEMSGFLLAIGVVMKALSLMKVEAVSPAVLGEMLGVMYILTGLMFVISRFAKSLHVKDLSIAALGLIELVGVFAALGGVLWIMQNVKVDITALASMLILEVALTALMFIISLLSKGFTAATIAQMGIAALGIAMLVALCAGIALVLKMLKGIDGKEAILQVAAMALLMGGLLAVLAIIAVMAPLLPQALIGAAAIVVVVGLLAVIMAGIMTFINWSMGDSLTQFGSVLKALGEGLEPLAKAISMFGPQAITSALSLIAVLLLLTAADLINGVLSWVSGKLGLEGANSFSKSLVEFVETLAPIALYLRLFDDKTTEGAIALAALILAITLGEVVSGIYNFIAGKLGLDDPKNFAKSMLEFVAYLVPVAALLKYFDDSLVQNAEAVIKLVLALTAADLLSALGDWVSGLIGEKDLKTFGERLVSFAEALQEFDKAAKGIDSEAVSKAAIAAELMVNLEKALPRQGGAIQSFIGEKNLGDFGHDMKRFGKYLVDMCTLFGEDGSNINKKAVQTAANCGEIMSKLADNIPTTGGILQFIIGEQNLEEFGKRMKKYGKGLVGFCEILDENKDVINQDAVDNAAKCGEIMVALNKDIPDTGGLKSLIFGDNDLGKFGDRMKKFGEGLANFGTSTAGINHSLAEKATALAGDIIAMGSRLDLDGGFLSWFNGELSVDDYGARIGAFGYGIAALSENAKGVAPENIQKVSQCIESFGNILNHVPDKDTLARVNDIGDVSHIPTVLSAIGKGLTGFASQVAITDVSALDSASVAFGRIATAMRQASGLDYDSLSKFGESLTTVAGNSALLFGNAFKESAAIVNDAGGTVGEAIVDAMAIKMEDILTLIKGGIANIAEYLESIQVSTLLISRVAMVCNYIIDTVRSKYNEFYNAGAYAAEGFINGISDQNGRVYEIASELARTTLESMQETLDEHSPSKETYRIAEFAGMGFINALYDSRAGIATASDAMANTARDTLIDSMSRIGYLIQNDLDISPVITPVLDLSNVSSGIGSINGMLNSSTTLGNISAIGGIGRGSSTSDIVKAINSLRTDLGNMGGNTYNNIAGISYDDDSSITNAVADIVTAAKIGGRV